MKILNEELVKIKRLMGIKKINEDVTSSEGTTNPEDAVEPENIVGAAFNANEFLQDIADELVGKKLLPYMEEVLEKTGLIKSGKVVINKVTNAFEKIEFEKLSSTELSIVMRQPLVREAMEKSVLSKIKGGAQTFLTDKTLRKLIGPTACKLVDTYVAETANVLRPPDFIKKISNVGEVLKQFFQMDDLVDFLKYKWKSSVRLQGVFTVGSKELEKKMAKLNDEIKIIADNYSAALKSGTVTDYSSFRKEIFEKLTVYKRMGQQIKRNCLENLLKVLPQNVQDRLDIPEATNSYSEKKLNELWDYICEKGGPEAKQYETKYTSYIQGWIKMFAEKDVRGQRILRTLTTWDARINSEFTNNIKALKFGRTSFLAREIIRRSMIMAVVTGSIDYLLAMKENVTGNPFSLFGHSFEPIVKWEKNDENTNFTSTSGYKYMAQHILSATLERFKSHPIESLSEQGPLLILINRAMSDPRLQRKRSIYESETYKQQEIAMLTELHKNDPEYKKLTTDQEKTEYDDNAKQAFQIQYANDLKDWEELKNSEK